jgi:hypothetical protein
MTDRNEAQQALAGMITGYWLSQAVYVAAKLELADRLADAPRTADELAADVGAHGRSLYRLLRALASAGVFAEDASGRFSLTPLADLLRRDVPGSQWAWAVMMGEEHYYCWGDLLYSVETGQTAFDRIYGEPIFDFLSQNPEKAQVFDAAMVNIHGRETAAVIDAYDLSRFETVADVGGGNGSLLRGVLKRHPSVRGILFDLPHVVERADPLIKADGLSDRVRLVAGDFFQEVPAGADAYLLRHIIHDWDDAKSLRILKNVRRAIGDEGRLLLVESVIAPGNEPSFGKLLDLTMLLLPGGQERTEAEYRDLLAQAGFRLSRIVPTEAEVSVIEAVKE